MKKITALFFAVIILLQVNTVRVAAESPKIRKMSITISNIDTSSLFDTSPRFSTEIKIDGTTSSSIKIIGEKWRRPDEFIISSRNIPLIDGVYGYELRIRSDGTLNFNNDLEILYQGVDGKYSLDYTIDETDNHIMIVTGLFENIITASPALDTLPERGKNWVLENFSDDSYAYELNLRTQEGFTFKNTLQYMFRSIPCVYSVDYMYELLNEKQAVRVNGQIGEEFEYYVGFMTSKQEVEIAAKKADLYRQYFERVADDNSDLIDRVRERAEQFTGVSRQEAVQRVEQFVNDHRDYVDHIVENIDMDEIHDRFSSFFGSFGH